MRQEKHNQTNCFGLGCKRSLILVLLLPYTFKYIGKVVSPAPQLIARAASISPTAIFTPKFWRLSFFRLSSFWLSYMVPYRRVFYSIKNTDLLRLYFSISVCLNRLYCHISITTPKGSNYIAGGSLISKSVLSLTLLTFITKGGEAPRGCGGRLCSDGVEFMRLDWELSLPAILYGIMAPARPTKIFYIAWTIWEQRQVTLL